MVQTEQIVLECLTQDHSSETLKVHTYVEGANYLTSISKLQCRIGTALEGTAAFLNTPKAV